MVYQRVGISLVKVHDRVGKSVISVGKKGPKSLTDAFYGCKKSQENVLVLRFVHILKTVRLRQLKGMQSSKIGVRKGYQSVNRRYTKGIPFLSKMA